MRCLEEIMRQNSPTGIVFREALKNNDWDTIDLLSHGSGYEVNEEEMRYYLENKTFNGLFWED